MQKQKIDSVTYLVLQNSYEDIQIALFNDINLIGKRIINKTYASKDLIYELNSLLMEYNCTLDMISFIGVNQGPSPFTTLRVVVATANAINFNGDMPLIGIDGLEALNQEYENLNYPITITLLNAYNNDIYFSINEIGKETKSGWQNIMIFLSYLKANYANRQIRFIGNGVDLFKKEIEDYFSGSAVFVEPNPKTCSIGQIATMSFNKWQNDEDIIEQLVPLYLKDAVKFKSGIA